jgi:CelD/BcsL family acetyltransferase involved in cellulose biosynthesis
MPLRAEIITNGKAFEALAPQWWELWRRCPSATPFQTPALLLPWWRHFAPGQLVAIAVWREDRLIGLAPGTNG